MSDSPHVGRGPAVMTMVIAAGVALAAGELASGAVRAWRSPVVAVAEVVIDRAPPSLTKFGIETFGTNDKLALVVTILAVLAVAAVGVGLIARRHRWVATVAFVVLALVGVLAAADGSQLWAGIPAAVAGGVGIVVWRTSIGFAQSDMTRTTDAASAQPGDVDRRRFLVSSAAFAVVGATAVAAGRALRDRFSAAASRAALILPDAPQPLAAAAAGTSFDVDGLAPLYTPNATFYRIDTALTVPQLPVEDWSLKVTGMVDDEVEFDFDQLTELGLVESDITLTCVSNQVGGDLVGNARWLGVPLRTVIDAAGVQSRADQIVGRSSDGYTCGFPVDAAYDRDAIVAVGMNGEPLPLAHGFPARLVTPGLYGYVSATKWLTEIELTRFDTFEQYWVPRGYAVKAPIKTMARIDVPRSGQRMPAGETTIAGVAWSQPDGISRVEVKIDGPGSEGAGFVDAEMADALNDNTWRQWRMPWSATEGNHRITVRATDGNGVVQTEQRAPVLPDGASGWQNLLVVVTP